MSRPGPVRVAGDVEGQAFARRLGAVWAGESGERPPEALDAALIFAPADPLIADALRQLRAGAIDGAAVLVMAQADD